jgi:simple sugar transport system substrate-binding protein
MSRKWMVLGMVALLIGVFALPTAAQDEIVFGVVLVGPQNDRGWSQAHYEGGVYVEENLPGARMIVYESLNSVDSPETSLMQVAADFIDQGARIIFTASDEFEEFTDEVAEAFPDTVFINISGDNALTGEAPSNVGNLMAQMEWGKLIAGCAAGLATQTGSIGYLGPLINGETRRLASSAYLGARYCYESKGGSADELTFTVTWIGFWFNIPGVTLDPTEETNSFYDNGADVVISGIDTTEAIVVAGQRAGQGDAVFAVPYDYVGSCEEAPTVCLGVPYFNWGPDYLRLVQSVAEGTWEQDWQWTAPNWEDMNNIDTSPVGFVVGEGIGENAEALDAFMAELAAYATNPMTPNSFALWQGPLMLQDGTELAAEGQPVDPLDVWYLPQLLSGMIGASN